MSHDDPIAANLDRRYRRCCQPRHHEHIRQRWSSYPALAGRSVPDIRHTAASAERKHNPVLADLLRAHQAGDSDATTVLLCAFIPYVCRDPAIPVGPDRIADRWAALARLLATTDPADADRAGEHRAFLHVLVGRMRRHAARLRYDPDRHVSSLGYDPDRCAEPHRDSHDAIAHRHHTAPGAVEDQALARLDLQIIADHLRAGTITPIRWRRLVDSQIHGDTTRSERRSVGRTIDRLAVLTGHVA